MDPILKFILAMCILITVFVSFNIWMAVHFKFMECATIMTIEETRNV
jgi:hypothetical protein